MSPSRWGKKIGKIPSVFTNTAEIVRDILCLGRGPKLFFVLQMSQCRWYIINKKNYISLTLCMVIIVQFSSVTQSCLTLCDPMNRSTPGLPVHHHLPEFTQTHVHRVRDAIEPSHPGSSPSPAPNPSQHQSLFQ